MEFEGIAGILKLSTKYDIPHVRSRAISHLAAIYPMTLTAWDQREMALQKSSFSPFAVLELAQSMDIPQILPAVFFDCAIQSTVALLDGFKKSVNAESDAGIEKIYARSWTLAKGFFMRN